MKRLARRAALMGSSLLLGACMLGPDYERPELVVPDDYVNSVLAGESFAYDSWWTVFNDSRLEQLIETALRYNKDMAIAMARLEEARAQLGFVRADYYPTINGQAGASRGTLINGLGTTGSIQEQYILAGNLSYELDLWGRVRRSNESARAALLASQEARNVITSQLVADVATGYLFLLDLDNRIDVALRTRDTRVGSLEIIKARYDQGTVALLDVNQAEIELADAQAELASLEREQGQAENFLSVLLGQNPGTIERVDAPSLEQLSVPIVPIGLPSELLERRPDIRRAEASLAAQTAQIGVAKALRFPTLSLTGTLGLVSDDLSDFISSDNEAWSVSGSLLGPIFDAGRSRSRVAVEEARTQQAIASYEKTVLLAFREVEDALIELRTYRLEAEARQMQKTAARSAAALSRARHDGGVTSYLEVLESERSLFRAELLASVTLRQQLVALIDLYKALGGGWPSPEAVEEAGSYLNAVLPEAARDPLDTPP